MDKKGDEKPKMSLMEMIHFNAIFDILSNSEEYVERKIRRWAVKELNISYFQTFEMSWPDILQHYYEASMILIPKNELIKTAKEDYLDTIISDEERENEAFVRRIEKQEAERLQALKEKEKEKQSLKQGEKVPEIKEMNLKFNLKE